VLLFAGEPGIGKTRLLGEVCDQVVALGGVALFGRAFEAEMVRRKPVVMTSDYSPLGETNGARGVARSRRAHHALVVAVLLVLACGSGHTTGAVDNGAVEDGGLLALDARVDAFVAGETPDGSTPSLLDSTVTLEGSLGAADASITCVSPDTDAGTCNSVEPAGPVVTSMCSDAEPPQPEGGTIVDGTYVLETNTVYGPCPSPPIVTRTTWVVCGSKWDGAQLESLPDGGTLPAFRSNFLVDIQATSVAFSLACEPTDTSTSPMAPRSYTATPDNLTFIYPDNGAIHVTVYARQ
jgi:hypothetical protein